MFSFICRKLIFILTLPVFLTVSSGCSLKLLCSIWSLNVFQLDLQFLLEVIVHHLKDAFLLSSDFHCCWWEVGCQFSVSFFDDNLFSFDFKIFFFVFYRFSVIYLNVFNLLEINLLWNICKIYHFTSTEFLPILSQTIFWDND